MSTENNGFDDIRRIRQELADLRGQRDAVMGEHLASVTDETAIELINNLGWGLCDRLKTTRKLLEDCLHYDFPAQRFLKDTAEATFANEEGFHIIKNNHALLLVAQKELDTVVKAKEAAEASSPKEIYADSLKAILLAWERIGVVITYNDLLEIAENGIIQQFDDLASFPYQWLTGYLSSWMSLSPMYRLRRRIIEQVSIGETVNRKSMSQQQSNDWPIPNGKSSTIVENELIAAVFCEIASRLPELTSYAGVACLLRDVSNTIENDPTDGKEIPWTDTAKFDESGEAIENDILDEFDLEESFLAKADALWLLRQAQAGLSELEFQVLLLDIADRDKKPSLREVSEKVGTTIKTVDSCRRRYRSKLKAILSSAA